MLNLQSKSFLQEVLEEEKRIFIEERIDTIKTIKTDDDFVDGNVLYKIPINRTTTKELIDHFVYPTTETNISFTNSNHLLREVTDRVLNIEVNGTVQDCLKVILKYRQAAGKHFYGALLRDTNKASTIINPFHILSAISLLNDESLLERKYKVIMYFYKDRDKADKKYKSKYASTESIEKNIDNILLSYTNKLTTDIKITEKRDMDSEGNVQVKYKETKHPDEDPRKSHYIVTHQLVTKGIMAPYYGTSLVDKHSSGSVGIHLSPMRSCNISQNSNDVSRDEKQSYSSICCGNLSSATLNGLRSLTHSNLSSPYNENTLMPGFMPYVDRMIEKCIDLYARAGVVEALPEKEICPYTKDEMACTTLRDFLIMNKLGKKTKLKPAQLEDKYNEIQEYKERNKGQEDGEEKQEQEDTCEDCSD